MRILTVEDDQQVARLFHEMLEDEGNSVDNAGTGEEAEILADTGIYDLIMLDVNLPGKDGFTVCREMRECRIKCPILMVTCRVSPEDKVKGLDSGADDYVTKPFSNEELLARVRALLRRQPALVPVKLTAGNLILDTRSREVWLGEKNIRLAPKDYDILELFMRKPNIIIGRSELEGHVWGQLLEASSNVVDVHINRLRHKIGHTLIETVPKLGYRLRVTRAMAERVGSYFLLGLLTILSIPGTDWAPFSVIT